MSGCAGGRVRTGRRLRAVAVIVGAALVLVACRGVDTSSAQLDAQFVDSVRADGHDLPAGPDGQSSLVAAAWKTCERRVRHATPEQRRDTALTRRELDGVTQTFAGDPRRFAGLALDTYCP